MSNKSVSFKPKARLLLQLGDQLIRNEAIAIFELVKNCYDAYANVATVNFANLDDPLKGQIVIEDDGDGMDITVIEDIWMQPGTDNKEKYYNAHKDDKNFKGRLPIGEKGIGRFGAYKLGNTIEVLSKSKSSDYEVIFRIDWLNIERADLLDEVVIDIRERLPEYFKNNKSGTKITISNLRQTWSRKTFRETVRLINTLNTPSFIKVVKSFKVDIIENMKWSSGLIDPVEIVDKALFIGAVELEGSVLTKLSYEFSPWDVMQEMRPRRHSDKNLPIKIEDRDEETNKKTFRTIDLSKHKIGKISIKIYAYSLDTGILKLGITDRAGFKKYLSENGGMKVYRDGMRVYDYGEATNDWLNMDIRRVNQPGNFLSNNQYIGYVMLDRATSSGLIEKSNREGFIENDAFFAFRDAVLFGVRQLEIQRNLDKEKLNNFYVAKRAKEPVVRRLSELKEKIEEKVNDQIVKNEIMIELSRIESEYNEMVDTFLKSANAGLNLGVAIHEIDKVIGELNSTLASGKSLDHAKSLASRLTELVKGYSLLLKGKDKGLYDISALVRQALFNVEFRLNSHGIKLETNANEYNAVKVKCARNISIGSIVNLIDNSIWWMGYSDVKNKRLYVGLSEDYSHHISVIVADNGPGYTIPVEDRIKPFISAKPTGDGMGLGLFIANECMNDQGGELLFPDPGDFELPDGYESGAITALAFRRNIK